MKRKGPPGARCGLIDVIDMLDGERRRLVSEKRASTSGDQVRGIVRFDVGSYDGWCGDKLTQFELKLVGCRTLA